MKGEFIILKSNSSRFIFLYGDNYCKWSKNDDGEAMPVHVVSLISSSGE